MGNIVDKIYQSITENRNVSPELKSWIENKYGKWHPKDFISDDGDTYFKYSNTSEGGGIGHTIVKLPSFSELIKQLKLSRDAANDLVKGESVRDDEILRGIYDDQRKVFNKFRTHLRKEYPAFYSQLKGQLTEEELDEMSTTGGGAGSASFTGGTGMQYETPYAFKKKKKKTNEGIGADLGPGPKASEDGVKDNAYIKQFKYSLVPKKIKGSGLEVKQLFEADDVKSFQQERIAAFDVIEQQLNDIYKMLSNAKNETGDYYTENPSSFSVIKPTDLVLDYIKDIKDLLKGE